MASYREYQARCQHAADRYLEMSDDPLCSLPATEWGLSDGTTGYYCEKHEPRVVERNRRRLARNEGWCSRRRGDDHAPDEHDGSFIHARSGGCRNFVPAAEHTARAGDM